MTCLGGGVLGVTGKRGSSAGGAVVGRRTQGLVCALRAPSVRFVYAFAQLVQQGWPTMRSLNLAVFQVTSTSDMCDSSAYKLSEC